MSTKLKRKENGEGGTGSCLSKARQTTVHSATVSYEVRAQSHVASSHTTVLMPLCLGLVLLVPGAAAGGGPWWWGP